MGKQVATQLLKIFFVVPVIIAVQPVFGQNKIDYGNNAAAGKYYAIRGMQMYVETYGSGEPVLLIHGNGGSISAFAHNIAWLAQRFMVIATDSRAHGKSTDNRDSLSFEMMADDESALLDVMHIKNVYVVGWSDGGIVALLMAMRHPDKVIKLASTGANLWPDSTAIIPAAWKEEKAYYDTAHLKTFSTPQEKNNWKIFMLDWLQPDIPIYALRSVHCPSLIIGGDRDVITLEHTVQIYKGISHAYLWIVPNSGHATLIEHRDEFNQKVADFFKKPFHGRD